MFHVLRLNPSSLLGIALAGLCLGTLLHPAAAQADSTGPNVLATYVQMAHSDVLGRTVPLVRVIVAQPSNHCPSLAFSDGRTALPMHNRPNPNPSAFGVRVCEAVVEVDADVTVHLAGSDKALPVPAQGPLQVKQLAVLGDSGCKGGTKQPCASDGNVTTAWPLPAIATAAAATSPDLVIHVGDYNYRGTPNKTGAGEWSYDGCVPADGGPLVHQSTYDTWTTWNEDFFVPNAPLLAKAPWVFTRGNHELCSRAGAGYFYFLDPHSKVLNPWVEPPSCDAPSVTAPPQHLQFANLDLILIDTANACGGEDPESPPGIAYEQDQYMRQLTVINALLSKASPGAWLVGHRPMWSLAAWSPGQPPTAENQTMQAALKATPLGRLHTNASMVLSGHMHQFFSASFDGDRQPQLVIGNSGVELSGNQLASSWNDTLDGMKAHGHSLAGGNSYGYLSAQVTDGGHWQGTLEGFKADGTAVDPLGTCALPVSEKGLCELSSEQ